MFLNDGKDIIYRSERTGWGHYYLYDNEGNFKHAITSGEWVAGPCAEIDTVGRTLYFYALGKDKNIDPYYYIPCRVNIDKPESLTQLTFDIRIIKCISRNLSSILWIFTSEWIWYPVSC